jgi:hypothetical protein
MDPETLYRRLGRLLETLPDFSTPGGALTSEQMQWLAQGRILIREAYADPKVLIDFDHACDLLEGGHREKGLQTAVFALHKALAKAELKAPATAQGAFIPAKNSFDAFTAINRILRNAKKDVLIVDPYLDEAVLTEFGTSVSDGIPLRLLSDQSSVKVSQACRNELGHPTWSEPPVAGPPSKTKGAS